MNKIKNNKLTFIDYEIPLLQSLIKFNKGYAKCSDIYPIVEKIMKKKLLNHPEEYEKTEKAGRIIWINKIQWAREHLKTKGQIDGSRRGIWKITPAGQERIRILKVTRRDPDEGLLKLRGIDTEEIEKSNRDPKEVFDGIGHETGDILGVKGIATVYEPINESGVIGLFFELAYDLDFRIEGIRNKFPDIRCRKKNKKGNWTSCKVEAEFMSSNFKLHGHNPKKCDLIVCWEHNWKECPIEVLCLKDIIKNLKK